MYGFPIDLDLSPVIGEFTTQIEVGQFDITFTLGKFRFSVTSTLELWREGTLQGRWQEGTWPPPAFYDLMNTPVIRAEVVSEKLLVLAFDNGIEARLVDETDQYECVCIWREGKQFIV